MARAHAKTGTRFKARRRAVELLFAAESRGADPVDLARDQRGYAAADDSIRQVNDFTMGVVEGVAANRDRIDDTISAYLQAWTLERLPAVDRAILRIAVWELFYSDVPPVVAVDQAVELAKRLSTDDSPAFVNGVLGRIVTLAPQVRAAAAAVPVAERTSADDSAEDDGAGEPSVEDSGDDPGEDSADDAGEDSAASMESTESTASTEDADGPDGVPGA